MFTSPGAYHYYKDELREDDLDRHIQATENLGYERAYPSSNNPDQISLRIRRRLFEDWVARASGSDLCVLDVGGRIQPYRRFLDGRISKYVAIDPQMEGLADIVAIGEALPFYDDCFDLVICAQVLSYSSEPRKFIEEIRRVLKRDGSLFLSVPTFYPSHHDEMWRFTPKGIQALLADFSHSQLFPEGNSAVGVTRMISGWLDTSCSGRLSSSLASNMLIPLLNRLASFASRFRLGTGMTTNYVVFADK